MTSPLYVATPDTPIDECMALMTDRRIRHVPVVDEGKIVGVISIGDLVKFISEAGLRDQLPPGLHNGSLTRRPGAARARSGSLRVLRPAEASELEFLDLVVHLDARRAAHASIASRSRTVKLHDHELSFSAGQ